MSSQALKLADQHGATIWFKEFLGGRSGPPVKKMIPSMGWLEKMYDILRPAWKRNNSFDKLRDCASIIFIINNL